MRSVHKVLPWPWLAILDGGCSADCGWQMVRLIMQASFPACMEQPSLAGRHQGSTQMPSSPPALGAKGHAPAQPGWLQPTTLIRSLPPSCNSPPLLCLCPRQRPGKGIPRTPRVWTRLAGLYKGSLTRSFQQGKAVPRTPGCLKGTSGCRHRSCGNTVAGGRW